MHLIWHIFFGAIIAILAGLGLTGILLITVGSILPDIDHILYMVFGEKITSFKGMVKFHKENFKTMTPHLSVFHFLELIIVLMIVFYFVNKPAFLISIGMALHWGLDAIKYLWFYKSFLPWIKYYSLIGYFISNFIN
jgi:type III secretory pathway component EscU